MTLWLVRERLPNGPDHSRERYDLTNGPCPSVNAVGIAAVALHQYRLEGDDDVNTEARASYGKPAYRVPLMEEVAALEPNGFTAASTFSGCGGSSLGYRMAGFRVAWASEFVTAAAEVYELNKSPWTIVDRRDVRQVKSADVLEAIGMKLGELDLFDGSPPCASFSTAGKRHQGWGAVRKYSDTKQRVDDLFFEYARLLDGVRPKVFIAENVSGLVRGVAVGYFNDVLELLRGLGYRVEAKLLDAQWLGVPQQRTRIIIQGVRDDLGLDPAWPRPFLYRYSVSDACPWITSARTRAHGYTKADDLSPDKPAPPVLSAPSNASYDGHQVEGVMVPGRPGGRLEGREPTADEPMRVITAHGIAGDNPDAVVVEEPAGAHDGVSIEGTAIGEEWGKLKEGEGSDKYFNLVRTDPGAPSPTVLASHGSSSIASPTHPTEKRKFSIAELKRLCAFPDDFKMSGTYAQQWERLGRAVPPLMMRAVAEAVRDRVLIPARDKGR